MKLTKEQLDLYANAEIGGPAIGAWPRNAGEKMRPHKGGGGGGDGGAAQREADRQARIKAATEEINRIFNNQVKTKQTVYRDPSGNQITKDQFDALNAAADAADANARSGFGRARYYRDNEPIGMGSMGGYGGGRSSAARPTSALEEMWVAGDPANSRDKLYGEQRQAIYDLNTREVNRQAEQAARQNKFALARTGLAGGSADVDATAELNRRTNEGLLQAGGIADQSAADLKAADERSRANLISMAQSGIDTGTASTLALEGLKSNTANAAAARGGATIGGLFNDMAQAYLMNQAMGKGVTPVNPYVNQQWYGVSSPQEQYGGNVSK